MLERLALVIHWIGFAIGTVGLLSVVMPFFNSSDDRAIVLIGLSALAFLVPLTCGWLIRFILTGNKPFLPWKSSK